MRKVLCFFLLLPMLHKIHAQDAQENSSVITHFSIGFEIGSNFLDIAALNSELDDLGLLPLDPYTHTFAVQGLAGMGWLELYASLTLMATYSFSDIIDRDMLFLSSAMRGTYVGLGVRNKLFSVFNDRLSAAARVELNQAYYFLNVSKAVITNAAAGPLLDSSHAILAHSNNRVIQPSIELLYKVIKKKNHFDIGFKLGYFYHLQEEGWENQHKMRIGGLSPIGNWESFNLSLKMIYTIFRCADRSNVILDW